MSHRSQGHHLSCPWVSLGGYLRKLRSTMSGVRSMPVGTYLSPIQVILNEFRSQGLEGLATESRYLTYTLRNLGADEAAVCGDPVPYWCHGVA